MKLIIDIPDKVTIKPQTFYFTVACKNGDIEVSSMDYFKEKHGIEFIIEKGDAEQELINLIKTNIGCYQFHLSCPECGETWWDNDAFPKKMPKMR